MRYQLETMNHYDYQWIDIGEPGTMKHCQAVLKEIFDLEITEWQTKEPTHLRPKSLKLDNEFRLRLLK